MFKSFEDYRANHQYEEFEYILRQDGQWYVAKYNDLYSSLADTLAEALRENNEETEKTLVHGG
jgi:hypothetical protein